MKIRPALSAPANPAARVTAAIACSMGLLALGSLPQLAFSQALATNLDEPNVTTYFVLGSNIYDINYSYPQVPAAPTHSWSRVTGVSGRPSIASGSPIASYVNTIYNAPEEFYLTSTASGLHVEQLWGNQLSPTDLNTLTHSSVPAIQGSSVVGFMDSCALTDNVFYVGTDQHIHMLVWGAPGAPSPALSGWSQVDLTVKSGTVAAGGFALTAHEASQSEEVFYIGTDHHVHELWRWSGCSGGAQYDGWHNSDVTLANQNGSPPASFGPLTSFFDDNGNDVDAVFFVDSIGHLHELYMSNYMTPVNEWVHADVTSQTGVAVGALSPLVSQPTTTQNFQESVYFLDAHSNVWVASSAPIPSGYVSWGALNLTSSAGAAPAAAHSPLAADVDFVICNTIPGGCGTDQRLSSRAEVYYMGTDQHVHMLAQENEIGPNWFATDLTVATGAP
jgi:hypothetical protein